MYDTIMRIRYMLSDCGKICRQRWLDGQCYVEKQNDMMTSDYRCDGGGVRRQRKQYIRESHEAIQAETSKRTWNIVRCGVWCEAVKSVVEAGSRACS